MTRLIDADRLKKALKGNCKPELCHDYNTAWCEHCCRTNDFEDLIDDAPTVEERPHGVWIMSDNMTKRTYRRICNQCFHISYFCGKGNYPNCPYCLADMREADNEQ